MRAFLIPVIAATSLAALPALAQSSTNSSNTSSTASTHNSSMSADKIEQKLKTDLSKAGYTNIKIVPGSFLVSAKDSDGQATQMMVSPHSVVAMTAMPQNGHSGSASGSDPSSNNTPSK